jgi:hypothetical protein
MDLVKYYNTRATELKVEAGGTRDVKAKQTKQELAEAMERLATLAIQRRRRRHGEGSTGTWKAPA